MLGQPIYGVDLYLIDDAEMQRANLEYMGCAGVTNILSFPGGDGLSGSLLVSLDTLGRECVFYGQPLAIYWIRLLAHGIAHLAQLEHGDEHDLISQSCEQVAYRLLERL